MKKEHRSYSFDSNRSNQITNFNDTINIELYKVLDFDIINKKILIKIYNQPNPIWLSVHSSVLSRSQYKIVSRGHLIGPNGIFVSSAIVNNPKIEIPKGMRKCYQCEFDEFIVKNNLVDEAITNGIVWETVSEYLNKISKTYIIRHSI